MRRQLLLFFYAGSTFNVFYQSGFLKDAAHFLGFYLLVSKWLLIIASLIRVSRNTIYSGGISDCIGFLVRDFYGFRVIFL